jgi:hypothetical protein
MRDWTFVENLKKLRDPLLHASGVGTLRLYADLLDEAVRYEAGERDANVYWSFWRPWVGSDRERGDRRDELLTAIRDDALELARRSDTALTEVVNFLIDRGGVLERVAHFVLSRMPKVAPLLVKRELTIRANWQGRVMTNEFAVLARAGASVLDTPDLDVILQWVEDGPEARADDDKSFLKWWRYKRLDVLSRVLPEPVSQEFNRLAVEIGPIGDPETDHPTTASFVGPVSPISASDLASKDASTIVQILINWSPTPGWAQPTPEGLGRELTRVVAETPALIGDFEPEVFRLHPTYVRALLDGIKEANRGGKDLSWEQAIRIALFAASAETAVPQISSDSFDADQTWESSRRSATWVLLSAAERDAITPDIAEEFWRGLSRLLDDPEPDPEHEVSFGGTNMDWPTLAINSIRPLAVLASIQFARIASRPGMPAHLADSVRSALDRHLDEAIDPSLAVRAVYGQMYPMLMRSMPAWTLGHRDRIFPLDAEALERWWAAWAAYLAFNNVTVETIVDLESSYVAGILRHGRPSWRFTTDPTERLAEHLVVAYANELIEPETGLMAVAAEHGSSDLWSAALAFAGRAAKVERLTESQSRRLRALWVSRRGAYEEGRASEDEIRQFGWWFQSPILGEAWQLENLEWVLGRAQLDRSSAWGVMERLAAIVEHDPPLVLRCVSQLVDRPGDNWRVHSWRAELKEILRKTSTSENSEVQRLRIDIVSRLTMKWGLMEFRSEAELPESDVRSAPSE